MDVLLHRLLKIWSKSSRVLSQEHTSERISEQTVGVVFVRWRHRRLEEHRCGCAKFSSVVVLQHLVAFFFCKDSDASASESARDSLKVVRKVRPR